MIEWIFSIIKIFIETFHSVNHIRANITILPVVAAPQLPKGSNITPEDHHAEQTNIVAIPTEKF